MKSDTNNQTNSTKTGKGEGLVPSLIKTMDYCWVTNDKKMKGSGLKRGDMLLVTGTRVAPATNRDPYLQRIFVVAVKVVDGLLLMPKDDNEHKAYLVDPRNLSKVPDNLQKFMQEAAEKQYAPAN